MRVCREHTEHIHQFEHTDDIAITGDNNPLNMMLGHLQQRTEQKIAVFHFDQIKLSNISHFTLLGFIAEQSGAQ